MIVYSSLDEAAADRGRWNQAATTLGFFDGLHLGHQKLLTDLGSWARELGDGATVITFDPHPQKVLSGSAPPAVLSLGHRLELLRRQGVDAVLVLEFTHEVASWSPEEFVARVLHESLGVSHLLLGFDSTIGHRRKGTYEYLSERAESLGLEIRRSEPLVLGGQRISSTLVRDAIIRGDLERVVEITGRPYSLMGEVVTGDDRGKSLGFPTANLRVEPEAVVPGGVYFARVDTVRTNRTDATLIRAPALVNIGRRPTFESDAETDTQELPRFDPARDRVEVHVLDFDGDLYGAELEIFFEHRERSEKRFESVEGLVKQIRADEAAARKWFGAK